MRITKFSPTDYLPETLRDFVGRRLAEGGGLALIGAVGLIGAALSTWSIQDPSWNHAVDRPVHNIAGAAGAVTADLVMQLLGIAVVAVLPVIACWGWTLLVRRRLFLVRLRITLLILGGLAASGLASSLPATGRWPLPTGLGGVVGDAVLALPRHIFGKSEAGLVIVAVVLAGIAILALTASAGFGLRTPAVEEDDDIAPAYDWVPIPKSARRAVDDDPDGEPGVGLVSIGALIHMALSVKGAVTRAMQQRRRSGIAAPGASPAWASPEFSPVLAGEPGRSRSASLGQAERREPVFDTPLTRDRSAPPPAASRAADRSGSARHAGPALPTEPGVVREPVHVITPAPRRKPVAAVHEPADPASYQLPPVAFLGEPRRSSGHVVSEDALSQNARLLEGVLEDFGVRGEIINVRPGPVVTLYELEPAPGIKSSRVIGLADDIARSMSAVSARVAVVQGRNAIGVELPNQRRETVLLREIVGSPDFASSNHKLAIALGKTIGGEEVIVDLARMPHLLVAGTTGSGKSVAINTMILSILYRLRPDQCRLIMIDPKMLELSAYDGIPHLLTPVVTDPKKAVVALKWAVREMEDRYKKMSKVGVRNIDGFNARVNDADAKGETITRTVQTGYDRQTGEAVYEQEAMELSPLPYIVVIVDEMADLMMVAGKDIEGAIQRLAQMARAAGIHLIMATQRPSVDVITGTIKANFPTRISFQVTSKIDSRTILGEQGAEQLLGQGDMLYMAGGGRIGRVHGPFVSDGEVETVVAHLKTQGHPDYLDAITQDVDAESDPTEDAAAALDGGDAEGGDLYDRAVAIVLRDKKCSTSYIQRRLQVGYNKAASLVERMEREGVVAPANHAGKREILVGGGAERSAFEMADEE